MAQQIIYTSAPEGLNHSPGGFCVVGSSAGMAKPLADVLVSLSSYKHLFQPGDVRNPTLHALHHRSVGGQLYYILSQIVDAGIDHLGRPNKVAHHVALAEYELPAAGPAWLLSQPDFMCQAWNTEPRILPPLEVPQGDDPPAACTSWYRLTGDAGWGGYLAERSTQAQAQSIAIIYEPGTEILPLIAESMALIDPVDRWNASFSTLRLAPAPPNAYLWQAAPVGSRIVTDLQVDPRVDTLDLTDPLPPPQDGYFVDLARRGTEAAQPDAPSTETLS
ncbi:MAG: hypothetical protein P8M80_16600 [Pirellulaceae bacterium]|nr:hypothetical protein [Pirellulaceae bacterium]